MFQRFYFFALSKSTGIESFFSFRTSRFFFLLRANRVEFERIHNLSTPLVLLRAKWVGFERLFWHYHYREMYALLLWYLYYCLYTYKCTEGSVTESSQIPLVLLWAKWVGLRGCISSQTPLDLLGAKKTTERFWMKKSSQSQSICSEQKNKTSETL